MSKKTVFEAEDVELTLTVRDVAVSITPELVEVVAHGDEYPVIDRVLEEHGLVTFAPAHDLVKAHSEGDITIRQLATRTGLSSGTAYDNVQALYEIHDLGDDDPGSTTYTPNDFVDEDADLIDELADVVSGRATTDVHGKHRGYGAVPGTGTASESARAVARTRREHGRDRPVGASDRLPRTDGLRTC